MHSNTQGCRFHICSDHFFNNFFDHVLARYLAYRNATCCADDMFFLKKMSCHVSVENAIGHCIKMVERSMWHTFGISFRHSMRHWPGTCFEYVFHFCQVCSEAIRVWLFGPLPVGFQDRRRWGAWLYTKECVQIQIWVLLHKNGGCPCTVWRIGMASAAGILSVVGCFHGPCFPGEKDFPIRNPWLGSFSWTKQALGTAAASMFVIVKFTCP